MKRARPDQEAAIVRFWRDDVENALLPLSQLAQFGMAADHPRALDLWLQEEAGRITDVLAVNQAGLVMPQCPSGPWAACAAVLTGREVSAVLGPRQQVRGLVAALRWTGRDGWISRDEPYMTLSLAGLEIPPGAGRLVPLHRAPRGVIVGWLADYLRETLGLTAGMAQIAALDDYDSYCAQASHVVLIEGGEPLCMTGFSGHQPGVVQIGGVYTPPGLRGLGLARRAVALHLAEARALGVGRAVLSASSTAAVRAYEAIGFARSGWWSLAMPDPLVPAGAIASAAETPHVG